MFHRNSMYWFSCVILSKIHCINWIFNFYVIHSILHNNKIFYYNPDAVKYIFWVNAESKHIHAKLTCHLDWCREQKYTSINDKKNYLIIRPIFIVSQKQWHCYTESVYIWVEAKLSLKYIVSLSLLIVM